MVQVKENILLAPYTIFKIGGLARYFAEAQSIDEVRELCKWTKKNLANLPAGRQVFVLGGGSNVLISDKGFGGLTIRMRNSKFKIRNSDIVANAGVLLAKLVSEAIKVGLTGLEWAIGIPGTVGGAVAGNAGAFGHSISELVKEVRVFNFKDLSTSEVDKKFCGFKYRDSVFKSNSNFIILETEFILKKDSPKNIKERIKNNLTQRRNSYNFSQKPAYRQTRCAGSFFKNIEWDRGDLNREELIKAFPELGQFRDRSKIAAGFLIEFLGLKGKKNGDAVVSEEHANFIVNLRNAKAEHVLNLSNLIKEKIHAYYGFDLEEEVQLVGFD